MGKYFNSAYKFGTLGGVLCLVAFLILSYFNPDPTNLNLVFGYVICPIAIFLAIKYFKEYLNQGYLSFAEGMTVGFVTYMIIATISVIGILITLLNWPELFQEIKLSKMNVLETGKESIVSQVGENSFFATLESVKQMKPVDVALNDGIWKIVPGLFFTIIISIILRKNPN